MEPSPQFAAIAAAMRPAVTPIVLRAGVGMTITILSARLGRMVDGARVLEGQQRSADGRQELEAEARVRSRRARWISRALALSMTCARRLCLTVTTLFVGSLLVLERSTVRILLVVTAMLSRIGTLRTFIRAIILATHHLRIGHR
jgi:hypothetical protein